MHSIASGTYPLWLSNKQCSRRYSLIPSVPVWLILSQTLHEARPRRCGLSAACQTRTTLPINVSRVLQHNYSTRKLIHITLHRTQMNVIQSREQPQTLPSAINTQHLTSSQLRFTITKGVVERTISLQSMSGKQRRERSCASVTVENGQFLSINALQEHTPELRELLMTDSNTLRKLLLYSVSTFQLPSQHKKNYQ